MKPFIFDPSHSETQIIARHDYLEFFVENFGTSSKFEFHINNSASHQVVRAVILITHEIHIPISEISMFCTIIFLNRS
jgi:hypothetical protein